MATVEAVSSHSDGQRLHAAELKNIRHALKGGGILGHTLTLTVTEGDRNITVPAFNAYVPDGSGNLVYVAHAGATVAVTASASSPRMDLLTLDASGNLGMQDGVATAETGNVREAPLPSLDDDEILIAVVRNPANQANVLAANIRGRALQAQIATSLPASAQQFVENSGYKGFFALGAPTHAGTYASGDKIGLGFIVVEDGTTADLSADVSATDHGSWLLATGATNNEDVGFSGPPLYYTSDWTMVARVRIPSAASQSVFIGAKGNANFADENNVIGFRISGTGNIIGVCDSGGTETTRDTGATGATECTLRIEVRANGTIVRFYKNNAQIGADVTTNIPTSSALGLRCGIQANTAANKTMFVFDLYGWREA